ncbi:class I SAM-dependent DNA methyltransferase [Auritidibacter ignavus]|uniref:Class I SAM-dependent methyltransferase n=1 Tax=Auritidibacter ignavus TaxID=678932 RepID=A0AAJ6AHW3_9MICC|nr:class I SAM-dependent methyltransferase [Auritidibacter ignavus]PXA79111.1 SAM-dependent methyltransferase [Auritidibacter sp. NML120779]WGH82155.1 class I SAM-dependent methyltransferase [Auritidibacter ignavus]WGH84415.1 class I SAM-dependent methyltransferase [Auritidibacter ignavus]WGH93738.1 class I SAM-dependent methyltransferase [Auritidibacter ignavus]WHS27903.1 class I SAM-dependent methyltransferase [Auritidibacter ignavus]
MTTTVQDIGYAEQFAGWYDRIFPKDASAQILVDFLARHHPDPTAGTLEMGVGTGRIAAPLARHVGQVVGVDCSELMLEGLRQECDEATVRPVLGDMRTYSEDRRYGLVYIVCSALALQLDQQAQEESMLRAAELLAPGGRLIIETHNRPGCVALHEGSTRTSLFAPYPEPNTGLQTYATLLPDDLWHCSQIWYEADGTHRIGTEVLRLLTPEEVDSYAASAGLVRDGLWADAMGNPYQEAGLLFIASYKRTS